ncbi:hypothetical protein SLEP1_g178 [Rubroshorea leprosula]|uniref:Uncharacterized protein n=1 Tax=Rubroshorea leprosula TaxID=152421 RepID=A0AAV5HKM1_9ROSI|nr:hypothetical protein SLEP1_g178 [Rubroshorea leprosula]
MILKVLNFNQLGTYLVSLMSYFEGKLLQKHSTCWIFRGNKGVEIVDLDEKESDTRSYLIW